MTEKEVDLVRTSEELDAMSAKHLRSYELQIGRLFRRCGRLEEALTENFKLLVVYKARIADDEGRHEDISYRDLSRLEFEIGYIYFLQSQYKDANIFFAKSQKSGELCGHGMSIEIAKFRIVHTSLISGEIPLSSAKDRMLESLQGFAALLDDIDDSERVRCEGWVYNVQSRLLDVAIEMEDTKSAKTFLDKLLDDGYTVKMLSGKGDAKLLMQHRILSKQARLHYIQDRYKECLEKFSAYLDIDLSSFGENNSKMTDLANDEQEIANDYYYAGKTLEALGENALSQAAFKRGLEVPPENGNHVFQNKIRVSLSSLLDFEDV